MSTEKQTTFSLTSQPQGRLPILLLGATSPHQLSRLLSDTIKPLLQKHAIIIANNQHQLSLQIAHIHENTTFFTTFSAGIAEFPQYNSAEAISIEADKALYVAKTGGRNQVCVAKEEPDFK